MNIFDVSSQINILSCLSHMDYNRTLITIEQMSKLNPQFV